jgi:hypothetical protein
MKSGVAQEALKRGVEDASSHTLNSSTNVNVKDVFVSLQDFIPKQDEYCPKRQMYFRTSIY